MFAILFAVDVSLATEQSQRCTVSFPVVAHSTFLSRETPDCFWQFTFVLVRSIRSVNCWSEQMIAEDISKGKENVKVPVVNELNDEKPGEFGVIITECFILKAPTFPACS